MITLHSAGLAKQLNSKVTPVRRLTQWALRSFNVVIAVNPEIRAMVESHVDPRRIEVVPAFLHGARDEGRYDAATDAFLASGRTLVVPAYRVRLLKDGGDSYGLDLAVEAFIALAEERPELQLAFFIAQRPSVRRAAQYLSGLQTLLEQAGLKDRVLIVFERPLFPALRHQVILVRPTRTDGDALSVREALHAGVPVVASDVVDRPVRTVTFRSDNVGELCITLRRVLGGSNAKPRHATTGPDKAAGEPFIDRLVQIYRAQLRADSQRGTRGNSHR